MSARRRHVIAEVGRFVRANLSSAVASGLEWVLVTGLVVAGVHYLFAAGAGAVTGAATDFSLKRRWAFDRARPEALGREGARYLAVSAGSLALNLPVAFALVDLLGLPAVPGVVAASVVVGVAWNYPLHRWWVFRGDAAPGGASRGGLARSRARRAGSSCTRRGASR
jgi:putative flippase GtrA